MDGSGEDYVAKTLRYSKRKGGNSNRAGGDGKAHGVSIEFKEHQFYYPGSKITKLITKFHINKPQCSIDTSNSKT